MRKERHSLLRQREIPKKRLYRDRILRSTFKCSHNAGMEKSTFSPHYKILRDRLVQLRKESGVTQRQLAEKLGREHSFIGRMELGDRRLDLVEFFWVCRALGADPEDEAGRLLKRFKALEKAGNPKKVKR